MTQVILHVRDMATSQRFYRDVLGLAPAYESDRWSEYPAGAVTIALHPRDDLQVSATAVTITLAVADLEAACAQLRARGAEVEGPMRMEGLEGELANLRDPDGVTISLVNAED